MTVLITFVLIAMLRHAQHAPRILKNPEELPKSSLSVVPRYLTMNFRVCIVACLFFGAALQPASAQRYSFKNYTQDQGLRNTAVSYLLQDHTGLLWVATQNGLFWYDGNSFQEFENSRELPNKNIESLHESADGTLWIGSRQAVARRHGNHLEIINLGKPMEIIGAGSLASNGANRI